MRGFSHMITDVSSTAYKRSVSVAVESLVTPTSNFEANKTGIYLFAAILPIIALQSKLLN